MNEQRIWWKEAVVYQIYPRSFQDSTGSGVGDINGIRSRLDYLADLGITVIWLSPIYESPNVDNGYDISNYEAILAEFGTMSDFDALLKEAHERNIKIVMDLVVNHTSDRHAWFTESRENKTNPKSDWYIWRDGFTQGGKTQTPNKMESVFCGSAWEYEAKRNQYYLHMFAKEQPDLNWDNPEVRGAIFKMMSFWLDKGIDGFRMDVISMISKPPKALQNDGGEAVSIVHGPNVHEYLRQMNERVLKRYDVMTVGETSGVTIAEAQKYAGYDAGELNMVFQFEIMDVDSKNAPFGKWSDQKLKLSEIKRIMTKWQVELEGKAWNSLFWANHDQPRSVSRFGDASTELFREKSAKMLALCLHSMKGTPYIYQGDEIGMTNYPFRSLDECRDIEIFNAYHELVEEKKAFSHEQMMRSICSRGRDNARTPMQWSAEKNAGFSSAVPWLAVNPNHTYINAENERQNPDSIFSFYKTLIGLRKTYPELFVYAPYTLLLPQDERIFAFKRILGKRISDAGGSLLVLCNFTAEKISGIEELLSEKLPAPEKVLLDNYSEREREANSLKAYEGRIYKI